MAYVTGTENSLGAIRDAIISACGANGWNVTGAPLAANRYLDRGGCFVRLRENAGSLDILGSNGIDVTNGPYVPRIGSLAVPGNIVAPITYHIFINTNPDEVYVILNYGSVYYQWLAWGRSTVALPGTGNWYGATLGQYNQHGEGMLLDSTGGGAASGNGASSGAFFWTSEAPGSNQNCFVHHGLDGIGWSGLNASVSTVGGGAAAITSAVTLVAISPNAWNSEAPLIPIPVCVGRGSGFFSLVAQPVHARYTRLDALTPGQVITIGTDQWMVFPWFSRNTTVRNGSQAAGTLHSGTLGWAIRYTP